MMGPVSGRRATPGLLGDTRQARQEQEGQVIEAGEGLGPDRALNARDLRCAARPKRLARLPLK